MLIKLSENSCTHWNNYSAAMANDIDYDLFKGPLITIGLIATAHVTNVVTSALTVESTMIW